MADGSAAAWRTLAPAWHTIGHVWTAASHGCLREMPAGETFTARGPDGTLGAIAAACPHVEFGYGGVVCEAIGLTYGNAGHRPDDADWRTWLDELAHAIEQTGSSCVFGGDAHQDEPLRVIQRGVDLRERMTHPEHFTTLHRAVTALAEEGRLSLDHVLQTWSPGFDAA